MSAVFSTIHETGHGIYEQQIGDNLQGTILGSGVLWEYMNLNQDFMRIL